MQQMAAAYGPYGPYGPYGMGMMPPPMPFPPRSQIPDDQQSIQSFHFDTDARSDRHVKRTLFYDHQKKNNQKLHFNMSFTLFTVSYKIYNTLNHI